MEFSAVDDSGDALAEARDLILGDMADRILEDVNGRLYPGLPHFYENCFVTKLPRVDYYDDKLKNLWPDDDSPFSKAPFVKVLKEWTDEMEAMKWGGKWPCSDDGIWYGRDFAALEEMDFQGKPDFVLLNQAFFKQDHQDINVGDWLWKNVLALGTVREVTPGGYPQAFLQACHQAQQVFYHQPDRLWLHGFLTYGFGLEFLTFDRSGVYTSESLDLRAREPPSGFPSSAESGDEAVDFPVVAMLMNAMGCLQGNPVGQLGVNDMIHVDGTNESFSTSILSLEQNMNQSGLRLKLRGKPIASPIARITDAGALCYRARHEGEQMTDRDVALKLSWEDATQRRETDMLKTALERGVWGIPELLSEGHIVSIAQLHGRIFKNLDGLHRPVARAFPDSISKRRVSSLSEEMLNGVQRDQLKRAAAREDPRLSRLEAMTECAQPETHLKNPQALSLATVVTAPFGKPLSQFSSPRELLLALRDAIKAHRSLYDKGQILHQDISVNNIIIPETVPDDESPHGILIDFDEARDLRDIPSHGTGEALDREHQRVHICGTRAFISIDLMLGRHTHSADHDLESFFYTLLWLCVCHHSAAPPMTSRLNIWQEKDDFPELAKKKAVTILDEKGWKGLLGEFTPSMERMKGLAGELRGLIFPGGRVGGGREGADLKSLYDGFLGAFDRTLDNLGREGKDVVMSNQ